MDRTRYILYTADNINVPTSIFVMVAYNKAKYYRLTINKYACL